MTDLENAVLHNVAETAPPDWVGGGRAFHRIPRAVGEQLNVGARGRYQLPVGCEIRFVPTDPLGTVEVELSAAADTVVRPFWGPFHPSEPITIGPEPRIVEITMPEPIRALDEGVSTGAFSQEVCRLQFGRAQPVAVHGLSGPARKPNASEVPDTRLLAYGTSITEGFHASAWHLSYVARLARQLGVDPLCLGAAGSAYCEPAIADYIAGREDWDAALFSISVNMASRGFTVESFQERAEHLLDRVSAAHPDAPVLAVTLYPYHADLRADGDRERAAAFRQALRDAVAAVDGANDDPENPNRENLAIAEGPDVMAATGLTDDLLHPSDDGMAARERTGGRTEAAARTVSGENQSSPNSS